MMEVPKKLLHLLSPLGTPPVPPAIPGVTFDIANGDAGPSVTRVSSATYWNSSKVLTTAAANAARVTYDPLSGERLGTLIEDNSGSNLTVQSNALDQAIWNKNAATITANTNETTDPAGGNAADIILETATTANHGVTKVVSISAPASDITVTQYWLLKAGARNRVVIVGVGKSSVQCVVDLTNGAVDPQFTTVSANLISAFAEPVGGGWVLCMMQFVVAAAATSYQTILRLVQVSTGQTTSYLGDVTKGVYHYHAQSRQGAQFDMPIFTAAAAVTRDQDVASVNISSWWSPTKAALVLEGRQRRNSGQGIIAQAHDGTELNRVRFWRNASGDGRLLITSGGADQLDISLGAWLDGTDRRVAIDFLAGSIRYSVNGGAVASASLATPPVGLTTLTYGLDTTGLGATCILRASAGYAANLGDSGLRAKALKRLSGSISCYGNSITAGQVTGQTFTATYPILLGNLMSRRTFNGGHGGDLSGDIKTRFLADLDHGNWINVIEAGRNDGTGSPSTILSNIASMVAFLPSNARYLVMSIPYSTGDSQATKDAIADINALLFGVYGSRFVNVDWSTITRIDGLHPDDAGLLGIAVYVQTAVIAQSW